MKKPSLGVPVLLWVVSLGFLLPLSAQEDEVTVTESVRVVNVEVPVRVFHKGEAVDGLSRNDFRIFENGRPQEIHGFYVRRKKIVAADAPVDAAGGQTTMTSRYFVLVFKIFQFNDPLKRGLDHLLQHVLRESDQCLVFVNDRTLFFKSLAHREKVRAMLIEMLREESKRARQRMEKSLMKVEDELKMFRFRLISVPETGEAAIEVWRFLKLYFAIWEEYSGKYLKPDLDAYYYFSRHLEKIQKEKWVINFYQIERFPKMKPTGRMMEFIRERLAILQMSDNAEITTMGKAIATKLRDIDIALHTSKDFPADEISKLFMKVDATFHAILIPVNRQLFSEDLEYKEISSELESSLREITRRTGGSLQATGNLESALEHIEKREDITYMLTYSPADPDEVGKIRVEVGNRRYRVLYDDQMRADYIREYLRKKKLEAFNAE